MPIIRLDINQFIEQSPGQVILDVRSPGEYLHACIPNAQSLPLFTDEERKVVGTAYKQQGKQQAIKLGLDFFGPKMKAMVEYAESFFPKRGGKKNQLTADQVYIHCWRGGMRSNAVAWLLDLYGFEVFLLDGGYKAYRNWVLQQFDKEYDLKIVGGFTGSGKTPILHELQTQGRTIIDLEGIAHHKGSAFGSLGQLPQPSQEMFENKLALLLYVHSKQADSIWIEDESQRIGVLNIPLAFWNNMRNSPVFFIEVPFEERLQYITKEYGTHEKEKLVEAIFRIQKRLGPLETKTAIRHLLEDNYLECFRILLTYYDKHYIKALYNRDNISAVLNKIPCSTVDTIANTKNILLCEPVST